MKQYVAINETVYFWFAGNDTSGSGGDGASPAADVRLAGAAANAAPVYSPTPVLLSDAGYPAGAHEVAIVASAGNGFAADNTYAVFCTLAIDSQNPTGFIGSFDTMPIKANTIEISGDAVAANNAELAFDGIGYGFTGCTMPTVTTLTGHVAQTGDSFARIGATGSSLTSLAQASVCTEARLAELTAANLPSNVDDLLARLTAARAGYLDNLNGHTAQSGDSFAIVNNGTHGNAALETLVDDIETILKHATYGNSALQVLLADIPTNAEFNARTLLAADYFEFGVDSVIVGTNNDKTGYALSNVGADLILKSSTFALAIADAIWDEILFGATHNIATSAGRGIRELGANFITSGTAQAGAAHSITLEAGDAAADHIYNRNLIVIQEGTGAGQTRTIVDHATGTKVAVVDRDWWINPDNTSVYAIIPDDTPLVSDHGVATAGTNDTITIRASASATSSTYSGSIIQIMAGTGAGQSRVIDTYNGGTKIITVCTAWTTNPDNTSVYVILPYGVTQICKISPNPLADIKGECVTALSDIKLDHLIAVADADDPVDNSIISKIAASDGDWSGFTIADDSLEAIRDRGDAAWITGAGGSPPTTLQNTTINALTSQTEFTIVGGSADDDAYNGCIIVVEDSITATQKCVGRILNYTGATKTVFLEADPGIFVMANGDTVDIIAVELTWDAATKALTDKAGFTLSAAGIDAFLDEVIGDAVHATPNSVGAMLHAVYCRFMQKRTATDLAEKAYKLDDITELKSFTLADDGTTTTRS